MAVEKNPYVPLVRLLEARRARQVNALADTDLQLQGAKESAERFEDEQKKLPLSKGAKS